MTTQSILEMLLTFLGKKFCADVTFFSHAAKKPLVRQIVMWNGGVRLTCVIETETYRHLL